MAYGDRKNDRVQFERTIPVCMMAIDGTWRRECEMIPCHRLVRVCILRVLLKDIRG